MGYVDSAVLDLTERMCRRFQTWTGRTNVWLAFQLTNLSIVVYFIWVVSLYWLSGDVALRVFVASFCGGVFFVLTRTLFKTSIEGGSPIETRRGDEEEPSRGRAIMRPVLSRGCPNDHA